jgi:hypothetical protein
MEPERAGFEPAVRKPHTGFRNQLLQPLGHLSQTQIDLADRLRIRIEAVVGTTQAIYRNSVTKKTLPVNSLSAPEPI